MAFQLKEMFYDVGLRGNLVNDQLCHLTNFHSWVSYYVCYYYHHNNKYGQLMLHYRM